MKWPFALPHPPPWPPLCRALVGLDLYQRQSGRAGAPRQMWEVRRHFGTALPCMPGAIDAAGNHQQYVERVMALHSCLGWQVERTIN